MATTFKIIIAGGETLKGQSIDDVFNFRMANVTNLDIKFTIEEEAEDKPVKEKKDKVTPRNMQKEEDEFRSTLSLAQLNDVHLEYKKIAYNQKIGWHLKVIKKHEEGFTFSPQGEIMQREMKVKNALRKIVQNNYLYLLADVQAKNPDLKITADHFDKLHKKLVNSLV